MVASKRPATPAEYVGSPDDIVDARRLDGTGAAFLEPNELIPGMPECDCHPDAGFPVIHEGDIVKMRRSEVVGFFAPNPEDKDNPIWNEGRSDFELAGTKANRAAAKAAEATAPAEAAKSAS